MMIMMMLPTRQIYVRGIFVEHSHDIFLEYSENVPYEILGNIPRILNVEIFPEFSMNILRMLHAYF